ncbi:MAG: hypothetical protein K9M36_00970 [Candidatus Pacebacteria bacterium]|nr:hypothetical protein [Candidatus Paceibacterota bacterium]
MFILKKISLRFLIVLVSFVSVTVYAATIGTSTNCSTNDSCAEFTESEQGSVNFNPTGGNVDIDDTTGEFNGYAWGDVAGWINLDPTSTGVVLQCTGDTGALSGYAWGSQIGWVNFSPQGGGVTMNDDGEFDGYAWSGSNGWLEFSCPGSACVVTDFQCTDDGGSTPGGGGVFVPPPTPDVCLNIDGNQSSVPSGYMLVGSACILIDVCPNIVGAQSSMPTGFSYDNLGNCVADTTDVCPNLSGIQASVPIGYSMDGGQCIADSTDMCPNISGNQTSIPNNLVVDENGDCILPVTPLPPEEPPLPPEEPPLPPSPPDTPTGPTGTPGTDAPTSEIFSGASDMIDSFLANETVQNVKKYFAQETPMNTLQLISTVALASGLAGMIPSFLRIWNILLSFLGIRRRYKPWGVVFDSATKQPLDPAYVSLLDASGKEVASSITDLDGRFGFPVAPGLYTITVGKTHYTFPSLKLSGRTTDELYPNLYFGEPISVTEQGQVITKNIPMDAEGVDWNEQAKKEMKVANFFKKHDALLIRVINILYVVGFVTSLLAFFSSQSIFNGIIVGLYIVMLFLYIVGLHPKPHGILTDSAGYPLSFAIMRIFNARLQKEVAHKVSDADGKYYCLVQKGEYYVTIERKNADGTYAHVYTSQPFKATKGVINQNFTVS